MKEKEKEMKQELARTLTGYSDCVDCDSCRFADCCYELKLANEMWEQGWRKDLIVARRESQQAIKMGKILQSR